jgi:hypothetical protein
MACALFAGGELELKGGGLRIWPLEKSLRAAGELSEPA